MAINIAFKDLPPVKDMPHGCAWHVHDKDGKRDQLGTLNYLTAENVKSALGEIKSGSRAQLDWSLNNVQFPGFNRKPFEHKIIDLASIGFVACDDEIYINTQSGSQWDGFKHVAHQQSGKYYNNLSHDDIISGKAVKDGNNGIDNWCKAGGIAGRGILLDWVRWFEKKNPGKEVPAPYTRYAISISDLEEVAKFQGTEFKPGDILLVRTGFVRWHNGANETDRQLHTQKESTFIGVQASPEAVEWFWNKHFAAVGGCTVAFEAWPPKFTAEEPCLHEWFLTHWGTPIGEMWDLEKLSELCEKENKWSFFLTSAPLHVIGGIGSPPNAIAIL